MAQGKFTKSPTPSNIVSAVNAMVDDIAGKAASSHNHSASNITSGTLAVARGGTGVTANPSMLTNLGSTSAASVFAASPRPGVTGTLPIANGGTGATTASQACANIGALPTSGGTITDFLTIKKSDKTGEPSIIFESNGGKKYSFYGSDDGIGIWDIANQKLATLIGNITGTADYANSAGNGVAEFFWHQAAGGGFYIRFNNGLILIAGYSIGYTGTRVTFPKAFSGGCSGVIACLNADETTADPTQLAVGNFSATGFNIYHKASIVMGIRYFAWGWA